MQRTQIYLPKSQLERLKKESQQKRTTVSALIRFALEQRPALQKRKTEKNEYVTFAESLEKIKKLGLKTKAEKDLSKKIDYYLYGSRD